MVGELASHFSFTILVGQEKVKLRISSHPPIKPMFEQGPATLDLIYCFWETMTVIPYCVLSQHLTLTQKS